MNSSSPLISVIVPVYKSEPYLAVCLQSIMDQTYPNLEVICVDDGSPDRCPRICDEFAAKDKRIRVLHQKNSGSSRARNAGIDTATGEFLLFADADDRLEPNYAECLMAVRQETGADMVICGMSIDFEAEDGTVYHSVPFELEPRHIAENRRIPEKIIDLFENGRINGPYCKLIRAEVVKGNQLRMPPDIALQEDLWFILEVLSHIESLAVIRPMLYHYMQRGGESVTSRYFPGKYDMLCKVHDKTVQYFADRTDNPAVLGRIYDIHVKNTFACFMNFFHPACPMSKKGKLEAIRTVCADPVHRDKLRKARRPGMKYRLIRGIMKTNNSVILYHSAKLFDRLKKRFNVIF